MLCREIELITLISGIIGSDHGGHDDQNNMKFYKMIFFSFVYSFYQYDAKR